MAKTIFRYRTERGLNPTIWWDEPKPQVYEMIYKSIDHRSSYFVRFKSREEIREHIRNICDKYDMFGYSTHTEMKGKKWVLHSHWGKSYLIVHDDNLATYIMMMKPDHIKDFIKLE